MKRFCNGTDPNLVKEVQGVQLPCDCGSVFDDAEWSVTYPHQNLLSTRTLVEKAPPVRRTKCLFIAVEIFVDILLTIQKGEWIGAEGIPEDLRVLNAEFDLQRMCFRVLVESQTFDEVPPYAVSPDWSPTFTRYSTRDWEKKLGVG